MEMAPQAIFFSTQRSKTIGKEKYMSVGYRTLADLASGFQQWFTDRFTITGILYQSVVLVF